MSASEHTNMKAFIDALLDAWNARDIERVVTFYSPDYEGTDVADPTPQKGQEGIRRTLTRYYQAFPDLHFQRDITVVEDNCIALFWTAHGTHQGTLLNIPPTHRHVRVQGVSLLAVEEGKVVRGQFIWDVAGLLRGIGLLPELR